jgi:hypothetical protein
MALMLITIPDDIPWSDYFCDDVVSVNALKAPEDDGDWEVVGQPKLTKPVAQPLKWCRDGNKCSWRNCKFRHERCVHYDTWIKRGKRGHSCRSLATDANSNKRPEDGGCKYDHRDPSKLHVFLETLPCDTEQELWDNFYPRGLECYVSGVLDPRGLLKADRQLMIRSLKASNVEFEDNGDHIYIDYADGIYYPPDDDSLSQ